MDPVSIILTTATAINILNTLQSAFAVTHRVNKTRQSAKITLLISELRQQQRRTKRWMNKIYMLKEEMTQNEFKKIIAPEDQKEVNVLVESIIAEHHNLTDRLTATEKFRSGGIGGVAARVKLATGGLDELQDLLDSVTRMNNLLYELAPPNPPNYAGGRSEQHPHIDAEAGPSRAPADVDIVQLLQEDHDIPPRESEPEPLRPSLLDMTVRHLIQNDNGLTDIRATDPIEAKELKSKDSLKVKAPAKLRLGHLFEKALSAINIIAIKTKDDSIAQTAQRMRKWGYGLFNSSASLDVVLSSGDEDDLFLAGILQNNFIEILVLEVQELIKLISVSEGSSKRELEDLRDDIKILLFEDDSLDAALAYSDLLLHDMAEHWLITDDLENTNTDEPDQILVPKLYSVGTIVADLFYILPDLRSIRQAWCLKRESAPPVTSKNHSFESVSVSELTARLEGPDRSFEPLSHSELNARFERLKIPNTDLKSSESALERDVKLQLLDIKLALEKRDAQVKGVKAPAFKKVLLEYEKLGQSAEKTGKPAQAQSIINSFMSSLPSSDVTGREKSQSNKHDTVSNNMGTMQLYKGGLPLDEKFNPKIDGFITDLKKLSQMEDQS